MSRVRWYWWVAALCVSLVWQGAAAAQAVTERPKAAEAKTEKAKKEKGKTEKAKAKAPAKVDPRKSLAEATTPVPRKDQWWLKRHESMNARVKQGKVDLVLIGDSITHGWEGAGKEVWKKFYGNRNAVNLGIGGDRTQHVIWRLQNGNLEGIAPKLAVLMIGTNNSNSDTPEAIAAGIKGIVETICKLSPKTKILILGIFPRGDNDKNPLRQVNQKANAIICKLADNQTVFYLDIGKAFLQPDGTLTHEVMPDLLHLNPKSYTTWAESIEPMVVKLMGEKQ